jgi:hypothetical protein
MGWEYRGRHGPYYIKKVRVNGKVTSKYIGGGEFGAFAQSIDQQSKGTRRQCYEVDGKLRSEARALIYTQKLMGDMIANPRAYTKAKVDMDVKKDDFWELIFSDKAEDRRKIKALLIQHPELLQTLGDFSLLIKTMLIEQFSFLSACQKEIVLQKSNDIAVQLGYGTASTIERLMIDRVVATFLHVQYIEWQNAQKDDRRLKRELRLASDAFGSACVSLAKVRKYQSKVG